MIDLNNLEEIKKLDPKDVYGSTGMFADQCQWMLDTYYDVKFFSPDEYKSIKNVVIVAMGGSAYGGYIVNSLFCDSIKTPVISNNDYHLPGFVDGSTLVMLLSYSGSTEEVLSCAKEAADKGAKIAGFCSGGTTGVNSKLGNFLKEKYPGFIFNAQYNPSGQPRLGTGYMVLGTVLLLNTLGAISVSKQDLQKAIDEVKEAQEEVKNKAIEMAQKLYGYIPVTFAAEHLVGNAHVMRNQFNETAKSFSAFEDLPELNHHLMEGLKNPPDKKLVTILVTSNLYSQTLKKRVELTRDVVSKNNVSYAEYQAFGSTKLSQVLNVLSFGGFLSLYLALLYGQDPSLIPWVDYFKAELANR